MIVVGIDPGKSTGTACYNGGALTGMTTYEPEAMLMLFHDNPHIDLVIIEDSRLQSVVFDRGTNQRIKLKIARDVGRVDCLCEIITAYCTKMGIPLIAISPLDKGRKLDSDTFNKITGWQNKSNQHTRDAAMVAWTFRHGGRI